MPYCTLPDKTKLYSETYGAELDLSSPETPVKPTIIVSHGGPKADHTFHVPFFKHLADSAKRSASAFSRADVELYLLKNTEFSTIDAPETVPATIRQFLEGVVKLYTTSSWP